MVDTPVRIEVDAGIVFCVIDRPPVNAIELEFVRAWEEALGDLERAGARAVVMTGAGSCFSAGLDLKIVPGYAAGDQAEMVRRINRALTCLYQLPIPTVAAVNGHAVAAGLVLALACDYRIGTTAPCRLGLPEARAGIPFPATAMAIVRAETCPAAARRLTLGARNEGPEEAVRNGILDELQAPEVLLARGRTIASDLATIPPQTYARIKHQLRAETLARQLAGTGVDPMTDSWLGADTEAAAAALLRGGTP
jgi:enoyl-CoA hydratase